MKNLKVVVFQQSWFQLGCLVESIIRNSSKFDKIDVYFMCKGLLVKPLDLHHDIYLDNDFSKRPENSIKEYLAKYFIDQPTKFRFHKIVISRNLDYSYLNYQVKNFKNFRNIKWKNTSVGMAISSFIITFTKDSNPNLKKHKYLIQNLFLTYQQIFNTLENLKMYKESDVLWVWNGRTFHERAVVEFANAHSIELKYMELGGDGIYQDRWILLDHSPHNRILNQNHILNHYRDTSFNLPAIYNWFAKQHSGGTNHFSKNFIEDPNLQLLDNLFVFFSSSDDEVAAISTDWESAWGDQLVAVKALIKYFENKPELNFIIRVHPNQKNKSRSDRNKWKALNSKARNIKIIDFDSKVDSYQLLSLAVGVITYGSTVGVESAFLRKPSALLSHALWDIIIPHTYIKCESELASWVDRLVSDSKEDFFHLEKCHSGSLIYVHYKLTAGNPWTMIETRLIRGAKVGFVSGISLRPNPLIIALTRFSRWCRFQFIEKRFQLKV